MTLRRCLAVSMMIASVALGGWGSGAAVAAAAPPSRTAPSPTVAPSPTLAQAEATVRAQGYTPTRSDGYDSDADLSVIIGRWSGSADGHPQGGFLFHRGRPVGTDTSPSATVEWLWSTGDVVALQYQLYRPDDPMCCPTGGAATVRYQWSGTSVVALDPVPPGGWSAPSSRREVTDLPG